MRMLCMLCIMNVMRTECYMLHVMITAPLDLFDGLPQGRSQAGKLVLDIGIQQGNHQKCTTSSVCVDTNTGSFVVGLFFYRTVDRTW